MVSAGVKVARSKFSRGIYPGLWYLDRSANLADRNNTSSLFTDANN